ncbi:MAG: hypothetical protein HYR63_19420 [Proteobacteria bacterium]|nr:hypothetical protein [Pseudomonadota bacterium]MBI3498883.1 hypothetical protein [Pseudomonadota bacterium]
MAMARRKDVLHCSFCSKSSDRIKQLISGPGCYICNECIAACNRILKTAARHHHPDLGSYGEMGTEQLLGALRGGEKMLEAVRGALQVKVEILRERAVSWADIGSALGISRQAAWERFS